MSAQITLFSDPAGVIVPSQAGKDFNPEYLSKDRKHRLSRFAAWLRETGSLWHQPDLIASPALMR